jgi:hypothetical protein
VRLHQAQDKPKQEPCDRTIVSLLREGRFFKTKKFICKKLNMNDIKTKPAIIKLLSVDNESICKI